MHKNIYFFTLLLLPLFMEAQNHRIGQGDLTTCSRTLFDTGGSGGAYSNSETITETYCSSTPGECISVNFTAFSTESCCDRLLIYDGNSTAATLIGTYAGTTSPGLITSTTGCLTFAWTSDGSVTNDGWNATLSCVVCPPPSINMSNGTTNTCNASFHDSGGSGASYNNSENSVYTICPNITGSRVEVNFSSFNTESGYDFLEIFDGNSITAPSLGTYSGTTSPGLVQATASNVSGCLTFRFISDGSVTRPGWNAMASCYAPCQTISANLMSTMPVADVDGIIRLCPGESVSLSGSAAFATSGAGATYQWDMGDGTFINGTSITHTYADSGSFFANLIVTDVNGCTNNNFINQEIRVATTPTLSVSTTSNSLCLGNNAILTGTATPTPFTNVCTPPVSGTTFLPDGSGVSYNTAIAVNCYSSGQTINAATDIQDICMNMEHSYLGDLDIRIICPNGQSAVLKNYASGGGGTYLGNPIDDVTSGPGTGFNYCFNNTATTTLVNGTTVSSGSPVGNAIVAGNYMPEQPLSNLVGCPVNGNWTIEITDNLGADDGYIFNWDINFTAAISASSSFAPTIVSQSWETAPGLTNTASAGTASLTPPAAGNDYYVYTVTDNFGCTYKDSVQVNVDQTSTAPAIPAFATTQCPNTTYTITASGGIAGLGSTIEWYTGPNGTGTNLGTGASINVTPTGATTYYARREGACNNSVDATVTIDLKDYIYALNGMTTTSYCTDNAGWHHFFSGDEIYLSVQGDLTGAAAGFPAVTINDNGSYYQTTVGAVGACTNGFSPGEEFFEMERSWNVDFGGGTLNPPYNVRFYYEPAERTAIENAAIAHMTANPACGYSYKYANPLGFYWFKNTGSNYTAPDYDGLHLAGGTATTPNGINYDEMTGITNFSGGSGGVALSPSVLLQVQWLYFNGTTDNNTNFLRWATESEQKTVQFNIQRSKDGVQFTTIGMTAAQGNSTVTTEYAFDDANPFTETNYYRLELVDQDGKLTYSNVILLVIAEDGTDYTFYPNPTNDIVNYQYEAKGQEMIEIEVMDVYGRTLLKQNVLSEVGLNQIPVDFSSYSVGSYVVRVFHLTSGYVHTKKIIKSEQ